MTILCVYCSFYILIFSPTARSASRLRPRVMWTQKLRSLSLLRVRTCQEFLSFKPEVALYASHTAGYVGFLMSAFLVHSTSFLPNPPETKGDVYCVSESDLWFDELQFRSDKSCPVLPIALDWVLCLSRIKDSVTAHDVERRMQTTIFRFRTEYCGTKKQQQQKYRKRWNSQMRHNASLALKNTLLSTFFKSSPPPHPHPPVRRKATRCLDPRHVTPDPHQAPVVVVVVVGGGRFGDDLRRMASFAASAGLTMWHCLQDWSLKRTRKKWDLFELFFLFLVPFQRTAGFAVKNKFFEILHQLDTQS